MAAMRALRAATDDVATRSGPAPDEVVMRFGLQHTATDRARRDAPAIAVSEV